MKSDLTPEQRVVVRDGKRLAKRVERVQARVDEIEEARTDVYERGRACSPPLTFRQLADLFGVTTQSVIQKIDRRDKRRAQETAPAA